MSLLLVISKSECRWRTIGSDQGNSVNPWSLRPLMVTRATQSMIPWTIGGYHWWWPGQLNPWSLRPLVVTRAIESIILRTIGDDQGNSFHHPSDHWWWPGQVNPWFLWPLVVTRATHSMIPQSLQHATLFEYIYLYSYWHSQLLCILMLTELKFSSHTVHFVVCTVLVHRVLPCTQEFISTIQDYYCSFYNISSVYCLWYATSFCVLLCMWFY